MSLSQPKRHWRIQMVRQGTGLHPPGKLRAAICFVEIFVRTALGNQLDHRFKLLLEGGPYDPINYVDD